MQKPYIAYIKSFAWLQVATIVANSYKSYWYYLHCQAQLDMPRVAQKPNSFLAVFQRVLFCKYLGWALVEALYNAFRYGYMYFAFFIVILHAQHVAYDINSKAVCLKYHMAHAKAHWIIQTLIHIQTCVDSTLFFPEDTKNVFAFLSRHWLHRLLHSLHWEVL